MTDDVWPNITGGFGSGGETPVFWQSNSQGAFRSTVASKAAQLTGQTGQERTDYINFRANYSNTLYSGESLQVPSAQVLMIIKT